MQPAALVRREDGTRGIAIRIAENISDEWTAGATIIFWESGEHSDANDGDYELVHNSVWELLNATTATTAPSETGSTPRN